MQRKASFKIYVTRREMLSVGDVPDHSLMLTEMEGEPLNYTPGVAGEFVSRRSVGFHDRVKGDGPMTGYATTIYQNGAVYSRFQGEKKGPATKGKWEVYKGIGKLNTLKGSGTFVVKPSDKPANSSWRWKGPTIYREFSAILLAGPQNPPSPTRGCGGRGRRGGGRTAPTTLAPSAGKAKISAAGSLTPCGFSILTVRR